MSELLKHPDRAALLAAATGSGSGPDSQGLDRHLVQCESCRGETAELRRQWSVYLVYHNGVLKPALPAPPRPWADLRERMPSTAGSTAGARRPSPSAVFRWMGAAAAVAIALVWGWQHLHRPQTVSAAELLKQAVASAPPPAKARKIVIRTKRQTLVRPAVKTAEAAAASDAERTLRSQFAAARYSWENPLSAASYQQWHDSLPSCTDSVDEIPAAGSGTALYRISTSTESGPLRHATISLRRADLAPVATHLEFAGETVDISVLSDPEPVAPVASIPAPSTGPAAIPAPVAPSPADELRVVGVLHSLGADLGEPIVIERTADNIRVSAFGLPPQRAAQLKDALAPLPQIRLEVSDSRAASPPTGQSANPASDQILELSDAVMARAFAVNALAQRFPAGIELQFGELERQLLRTMLSDHGRAMDQSLSDLATVLEPRLPAGIPEADPAAEAPNWQESAARVLVAARRLDQALNRAFASRAESNLDEVAAAMAQLRRIAAAHRRHWEPQR